MSSPGQEGPIDPWKNKEISNNKIVDESNNKTVDEVKQEAPEDLKIQEQKSEEQLVKEEQHKAEEETQNATYDITLTAIKNNNSVELFWTKYSGEFKSYKVSRSVIHSNPQYPGHRLRKTIPYVNETTYIDLLPAPGISYYVVSAIDNLNKAAHSNPIKVEFPNPGETPDQEIELTAKKTEQGVLLEWTRYDGDFLFYKIVRTMDHPYPKYPDDKTIKTIAYQNITTYLDTKMDSGLNYYAVTIIRPDKTRFTSKRASVEII